MLNIASKSVAVLVVLALCGCAATITSVDKKTNDIVAVYFENIDSRTKKSSLTPQIVTSTFLTGISKVFPNSVHITALNQASAVNAKTVIVISILQRYDPWDAREHYIYTDSTVTIFGINGSLINTFKSTTSVANWHDTKNDYERAAATSVSDALINISKDNKITAYLSAGPFDVAEIFRATVQPKVISSVIAGTSFSQESSQAKASSEDKISLQQAKKNGKSSDNAVRTALVIGNSAYPIGPLKNPVNDARDVAQTLKKLGFDVTTVTDATQSQMENAVRNFGAKLRKGGVGLFYYAGHGVQVAGENYLIPVNAVIQSEGDVKYGSVNAGLVLAKMEDAGNGLNIVILDACRSNPFARSFRSASEGLAKMDAPTGSLIAYSTAPGSVASDGSGRNGVFTKHLLESMKMPGLPISEVFMRVRQGVVRETAKKQVPWEASSLIGQFYFME